MGDLKWRELLHFLPLFGPQRTSTLRMIHKQGPPGPPLGTSSWVPLASLADPDPPYPTLTLPDVEGEGPLGQGGVEGVPGPRYKGPRPLYIRVLDLI